MNLIRPNPPVVVRVPPLPKFPPTVKVPAPVNVSLAALTVPPKVISPDTVTEPVLVVTSPVLPPAAPFMSRLPAVRAPDPTEIVDEPETPGVAMLTEPLTVRVTPLLIVIEVVPVTAPNDTDAQLAFAVTVTVKPDALTTSSVVRGTARALYATPELADAAFAANVRLVLSVMEATLPIKTSPVVVIESPTESSVVNNVPLPVTAVELVDVVIVPVLVTDQVLRIFQFPVALLVAVPALARVAPSNVNARMSNKLRPMVRRLDGVVNFFMSVLSKGDLVFSNWLEKLENDGTACFRPAKLFSVDRMRDVNAIPHL